MEVQAHVERNLHQSPVGLSQQRQQTEATGNCLRTAQIEYQIHGLERVSIAQRFVTVDGIITA